MSASLEKALRHDDLALSVFARCWVPAFHSLFAFANQDLDQALRLAQHALDLSNKHKIPSHVAWCKYVIAVHTMAHGDIESALEEFAAADVLAAELEFGWGQPTFRIEFAKALLARGRVEEARRQAHQERQPGKESVRRHSWQLGSQSRR